MKTTDLALCLALGLAAGAASAIEERPRFAAREFVTEYLAAHPREAAALLERTLSQSELDAIERAMTEALASGTPRCRGVQNLGTRLRLPDWESFFDESNRAPETNTQKDRIVLRRDATNNRPSKGELR